MLLSKTDVRRNNKQPQKKYNIRIVRDEDGEEEEEERKPASKGGPPGVLVGK